MKQQKRLFNIVKLDVYASLRRLRYDFSSEFVVFVASAVLLGLFFYIFDDFINKKLAAISPAIKEVVAFYLSQILVAGSILASSWRLTNTYRSKDRTNWLERLGEVRSTTEYARNISLILRISFWSILIFAAVRKLFPSSSWLIQTTLCSWVLSILLAMLRVRSHAAKDKQEKTLSWSNNSLKHAKIMAHWRLWQINNTSSAARALAILYILGTCTLAAAILLGTNASIAAFFAIFIGLAATAAMGQQFAIDTKLFWAERNMSVSHENLIAAYSSISMISLIPIALAATVTILGQLILQQKAVSEIFVTLSCFAIVSCAPLITPSLLFQLDPRRPWLQLTAATLITLFIGTAIYIHMIAVALIPLFVYYANQTQHNRFYRA